MSESGCIQLDSDVIRYHSARYGSWTVALREVRVIDESTDEFGPFLDDYFLSFATGTQGWLEASFYAEGRDDFFRALSTKLACSFVPGLCSSTSFASRVLWPAALVDLPMFQYIDVPPKTLLSKLVGPTRNRQMYSEQVPAHLAASTEESSHHPSARPSMHPS